ncbi:MAG: 7-cyano-7-deazaguanine synthase QueC, partial [Nitrospinaceae bacterium]
QYGDYWIANHRATPTNENENPNQNQPFGIGYKIVHNGTVSNDVDLGVKDGEIDSKAFELCLDVESVKSVAKTIQKIKGSYAIAILKEREIILACNYKPIFYEKKDGEFYFSSLKNHLSENARRMNPYTVMNLITGESIELTREQPNNALIICSGGLDSTAIIGFAKQNHEKIKLLHFNYGCKATEREIQAVKDISEKIKCEFDIVNLDYAKFKGDSTLFKSDEIESGKDGVEYALDWVYARNLILLSIATAYAEANKFGYIYLGINLEESGAYPDNEEQFIRDFNSVLYGAVNNGYKVEIVTPLGGLMKKEIVEFGVKYDSPIDLSWSCYNNGKHHCGKCAPCYMRKKAFQRAGVSDKTKYLEIR